MQNNCTNIRNLMKSWMLSIQEKLCFRTTQLFLCHHNKLLASFPGLPHFYLPFAFTIIHGIRSGNKLLVFCPPMQLAPYVTDYFPESFETVGEYVCHLYTGCVSGITSSHLHCIINYCSVLVQYRVVAKYWVDCLSNGHIQYFTWQFIILSVVCINSSLPLSLSPIGLAPLC